MKLFGKELTIEQIIGFCKIGEIDKRCKDDCLLGRATIDLIAEIERLQKLNAEYIETITNQWISIDDRLPECDNKYGEENVLVCMDDEFIATATYVKCKGFELWAESGEVTHWQLLPEPPKGEQTK